MKGMLKMVKNFISPDQIKAAARSMIESAIDFKNKVPLNADEGETAVTAIFYEVKGVVYFSLAVLNDDNKIVRFEQIKPLDELIETLVNKL